MLMNVFSLYCSAYAKHLRLWIRSWRQNGYTPKLITLRELENGNTLKSVVRRRGGGVLVSGGTFNISHRRGKVKKKAYGTAGWESAPVVVFPADVSESVILECLNNA